MTTTPNDDQSPRQRSLPQFGTRGMFVAVAICGLITSTVIHLGIYWAAILSLGALAIAAHVAATWIGHRMRAASGTRTRIEDGFAEELPSHKRPSEKDYAPTTKLYQRRALGLPVIVLSTFGCVLGIALPWILLRQGVLPSMDHVELYMGSIAFGLLGGIGTFLTTSFCWVMCSAWRQAAKGSKEY